MITSNNSTNNNIIGSSNSYLARTIGEFIRHHRLKLNKTQDELCMQSGIKRKTLTRIENGATFNVITLLQLLRSLDMLDSVMYVFKIENQISPILYGKMLGKIRQRARNTTQSVKNKKDKK